MRERAKEHKLSHGFRKIHESKCAEESCEFFGKPAQQGVCYHRVDSKHAAYIDSVRRCAAARMTELKGLRKINKLDTDKKWIRYLENTLECDWMNEEFTMGELIILRAKVGTLALQVAKLKAQRSPTKVKA